jgi:hypothetical protein
MRVITEQAINAFYNRKKFKKQNTEVYVGEFSTQLILFCHTIAILHENGDLEITTANHNTATTRNRLNGLKNVHVTNKKGELKLNGELWDGKLIRL